MGRPSTLRARAQKNDDEVTCTYIGGSCVMVSEGIIYVLTNPSMPGLVKIGKTARGDVNARLSELYSTGVPVPFECEFAGRCVRRLAARLRPLRGAVRHPRNPPRNLHS